MPEVPTKEEVAEAISAAVKPLEQRLAALEKTAPPAPPPSVPPTPPPPVPPGLPADHFTWIDPVEGASISGIKRLRVAVGGQWKNVEFFIGDSWDKLAPPQAPILGVAAIDLDTRKLPNGPITLRAHAWDAPAGQGTATTKEAKLYREFNVTGGVAVPPVPAPSDHLKEGWKLTFLDDFEGNPGDRIRPHWKTWFYFGDRSLPSNGELQYYMDPDFKGQAASALGVNPFIYTGRSTLIIEGKPAPADLSAKIWGYKFTSGLITTEASFKQRGGLFEMRAKTPKGKGLWPAFWLLPVDKTWPPEIDVLESFGAPNSRGEGGPSKTHWGVIQAAGQWVDVGADMTAGFHTYSAEWTPASAGDLIVFRFDDKEIGRWAGTIPGGSKEMYMLVNLAIGGGWAEAPNTATPWPAHYEIDWVRAYQRA